MSFYKFRNRFAFDEFRNNSPFPVKRSYGFKFRHVYRSPFYSCLIKRFVQYIVLRIIFLKKLDAVFAVSENRLVVSYGNDTFELHLNPPLPL